MILPLKHQVRKLWLTAVFTCFATTGAADTMQPELSKDTAKKHDYSSTRIGFYTVQPPQKTLSWLCRDGYQPLRDKGATNVCTDEYVCVSKNPVIPSQIIFSARANGELFSLTGPMWGQQNKDKEANRERLKNAATKTNGARLAIVHEGFFQPTVIGIAAIDPETQFNLRAPVEVSIHLETDPSYPCDYKLPYIGKEICIQQTPILRSLSSAKAIENENGQPVVALTIHNDDIDKFSQVTAKKIGNRMAILLTDSDRANKETNKIASLATIQTQLKDKVQITGIETMAKAKALARQINGSIFKMQEMTITGAKFKNADAAADLANYITAKIEKPKTTWLKEKLRPLACWIISR